MGNPNGGHRTHDKHMTALQTGDRNPYGPGEVMDLIRHHGFAIPLRAAVILKTEWQQEDLIRHRHYAEALKMRDQLPPCHDCTPLVFAFCAETATVCKGFNVWGEKGRRRKPIAEQERVQTAREGLQGYG